MKRSCLVCLSLTMALLAACQAGTATSPDSISTTTVQSASTTPTDTTSTSASPPERLPRSTRTLSIGETWGFDLYVGCGAPLFFNMTWWLPTAYTFTHPDYPSDWNVSIINGGVRDGPDAIIHDSTITLVEQDIIEIRTNEGDLVATYAPAEGEEVLACG